jgi:hypothetical protein
MSALEARSSGWLIVGILVGQLAAEGFGQQGRSEALDALAGRVAFGVELVGDEHDIRASGRILDPIPRFGCITATIALIKGRGVKDWPAVDFFSSVFFFNKPSS